MKRHFVRIPMIVAALGTIALTAGCAEFAQGLSDVANQMQQQQQQNADNDPYYHTPANTSAPGIK